MPLVIGATAAGFSIVRQLNYEEFGELYVADHPRLPRQQVLHLIPAEISVDLDYRERFNQESDAAAALWHPSIAGLTDRGEFEDQLWLSSEYIDGVDSAQLVGDGHPDGMPPRMVVEIMFAIADALDYAHDRGVLHRYVNPGSILVGNSPADRRRIALTGFGVARPLGAHNTLTRAGTFIGTASYTAPEQLRDDELDGRVDQYALAASAFHLLTGSPPFAHFNRSVVVDKHLHERPPRPSDVRPDLTEFDAIFARALSQDPLDRFRRCRDFAKALESNGGARSHIRATSELRAATIFREASESTDAEATTSLAVPNHHVVAPTAPAAPVAPPPPMTESTDVVASPNTVPDNDVDDAAATSISPAAPDDPTDDEAAEAHRRRLLHSAAIGGVIVVVLLAWFLGVRALRSASQSDETSTSVETSSAGPTVSALSPPPPPAVIAPPPPPPMTTSRPATKQTQVKTPSSTTTAAPTKSSVQATVPQTTASHTTTTPPGGLDTRPAVGMPCGPDQTGASAVSNSGGPVSCVSTPGGFAWESPGG